MKLPFERVSSYWVRYDKYVIRTDDKGVRYVTAEEKAKPDIFDPLADPHAIVLDALNVGRLYFMKDYPESQREAALLKFIHNYGLLGLMTALPTTPHFMDYLRVYLPKNHFIREESMDTFEYLCYFYPFQRPAVRKVGDEYNWDIEGDTDMKALAMTFSTDPTAMNMSFQREYAERLDWIIYALKDLTFTFLTGKYYYEDLEAYSPEERKLLQQGMAAFGGVAPTYRIALLDKPTIVWDFHSMLLCLQMMFSFMIAEGNTPLRMCEHCDTIFVAKRKNQRYCCDKCRRSADK